MPTKLSCFARKVVSLAKKAVGDGQQPPVQKGEGGYADWVIVGLHRLREYLGHPYRRLLDVLHEMPGIVAEFDLAVAELPDSPRPVRENKGWRCESGASCCGYLRSCRNPAMSRRLTQPGSTASR